MGKLLPFERVRPKYPWPVSLYDLLGETGWNGTSGILGKKIGGSVSPPPVIPVTDGFTEP
jgi:hypothetical protein